MGTKTIILCVSVAILAFAYMRWKSVTNDEDAFEQTIISAWKKAIKLPQKQFKRLTVGVNGCLDMIVPGVALLLKLGIKPGGQRDRNALADRQELQEAFAHFMAKGSAAERAMTNPEEFLKIVEAAETLPDREQYIGGNAALIAVKVSELFPETEIQLVIPTGPGLQKMLPDSIIIPKESLIEHDEVHLIMEYGRGQQWGSIVAPVATRFISSCDVYNSKLASLETMFASLGDFRPDLLVVSGLHMLDSVPAELQKSRLAVLAAGLQKLPPALPSHLELASMVNPQYGTFILQMVVPHVTSLGLNEQELVFLSEVSKGPHGDLFAEGHVQPPVHAVSDILLWLLQNYGRAKTRPESRMTRIHFHCLTFHIVATLPDSGWSNSEAAVAAGARVAGRQACDISHLQPEKVDIHLPTKFKRFSGDEEHELQPSSPVMTWTHHEIDFVFSPVLVCNSVVKTVGLGDAISATGLIYSQYDPPQQNS